MNMSKNRELSESEAKRLHNYKVYVHINKSNGKKYVGITRQSPGKRWQHGCGYKYNKNTYFWNAIQKYTWDGFEHIVLESGLSFDDAKLKERYYIAMYQSNLPEHGYNLTLGGDGFLGMERSEETKRKISESLKGKYTKEKSYWYGKSIPAKAVEKQKRTKRNNPYHHTEAWKIKHSEQLMGKNNVCSKPVRCVNTGEVFCNSRAAADQYTSADKSRIHKCCKGIEKSSGKHPITGERLRWEYVNECG